MELPDVNADLSCTAVVDTNGMDWEPSPSGTVWRKPLYRSGGEFGPVTSLVRYAAGGAFAPHAHPEGEEILVLDGVFSDEHGDYPAGSYLFNPDGTRHAPFSRPGCTLLVRLRQYPGGGRTQLALDTTARAWAPGLVPGLSVMSLYSQAGFPEQTALVKWEPGTRFPSHVHPGGEEILVVEGVFADEHGSYPAGTWLRNPPMSRHTPFSEAGCLIYVQVGGIDPSAAGMPYGAA